MEHVADLAKYAGPIALAAFSGVFLGGILLSFFWKNFGPWKLLEACRAECQKKEADNEAQINSLNKQLAQANATIADLQARYDMLQAAMRAAGLGLELRPINRT